MGLDNSDVERNVVFISKATPGDDEFVTWLAPKLEAAGYIVFADIHCLEPGDRWRNVITSTLQQKSIKMLLCCNNATLSKDGVREELGMAIDLSKKLNDPRFIIPLRLERYEKVFGMGELQWVDFLPGWENGLSDLLKTLENQSVPRNEESNQITSTWSELRKKFSHSVEALPEELASNWLRVSSIPDQIYYYECTGALNHDALKQACAFSSFPVEQRFRGFYTFATLEEVNDEFLNVGKFVSKAEIPVKEFIEVGSISPKLNPRETKNLVTSIIRKAWEMYGKSKKLGYYPFSGLPGFYANEEVIQVGKMIAWGETGNKRSSMLRNSAGGKVWQFGITATHAYWPFWHFKIKTRVVFAELLGNKIAGQVIDDATVQHRLRRKVCSVWRNKQWHGRMMAFLQMLSGGNESINIPLSSSRSICLDASPVKVISPVTTTLPDLLDDDDDEKDISTLGNYQIDEEEM